MLNLNAGDVPAWHRAIAHYWNASQLVLAGVRVCPPPDYWPNSWPACCNDCWDARWLLGSAADVVDRTRAALS